jgi:hypothetical protein
VKVSSAFGIPDEAPLLAATDILIVIVARALTPKGISNTATVRLRLEAESAIITEARGAILPADGADTIKILPALRIAESSVLLLALSAIGDNLADSTAIGILPAVGSIYLSESVTQK